MTQVAPNFVLEQLTVTGTGNITLPGVSLPGFSTWSTSVTAGSVVPYIIQDTVTYVWEAGQGTYNGTTLTRTLVQINSSGTSALINFAGNLCNVYIVNIGPIAASSGASSQGRMPMLNTTGQLDSTFIPVDGLNVTISNGTLTVGQLQSTSQLPSGVIPPVTFLENTYLEVAMGSDGYPWRIVLSDGTHWIPNAHVIGTLEVDGPLIASSLITPQNYPLYTINGLNLAEASVFADPTTANSYHVYKATDTTGLQYEPSGSLLVAIGSGGSSSVVPTYEYNSTTGTFISATANTIHMFLIYGQSWGVGGNNNSLDVSYDTTPLDGNYSLMMSGGVWPNGTPGNSFVPLHESTVSGTIATKETCATRASHIIQQAFIAAGLAQPTLLWADAAVSGAPYVGLKRGTPAYTTAIGYVSTAKSIASGLGLSLVVDGVIIIHGENDYGSGIERQTYLRDLCYWMKDFTDDIIAVNSQTTKPRFFLDIVNHGSSVAGIDPRIPEAQLDFMYYNMGNVTVTGPKYQFPGDADATYSTGDAVGAHLLAVGYAKNGEQMGRAIAEQCYGDGQFQPLTSLEPHKAVWGSGGATPVIHIQFNQPITIDTSGTIVNPALLVNTQGVATYGVDYTDGGSGSPYITGLSVVNGQTGNADTLAIQLSAPPTGFNPQIYLACRVTGAGYTGHNTGARSCIRSTASWGTSAVDGLPQYDWACPDRFDLPPL